MANTERKTIKLSPGTISTWRDVGEKGAKVCNFKGKDGVVYEVWSEDLLEFIKDCGVKDTEFAADVAYSEKESGDAVYKHWKIVQCYRADGSPVKQQKSSYRGGGNDDSPEKRKSIEDQTRAYVIADLYKADKAEQDLIDKLNTWLRKLGQVAPPPEAKPGKAEFPKAAATESKGPVAKAEAGLDNIPKHIGEMLSICLDHGIARPEVLGYLEVAELDVKNIKVAEVWPRVYKDLILPKK